jgi:dihydroorotase
MKEEIWEITIPRIVDPHCHFRSGTLLESVLPETARYASYGLAMPNTSPRAILTADDVVWYREEMGLVLGRLMDGRLFTPLIAIEIRDNTTPDMVKAAYNAGAIVGKAYPRGTTTNSDQGLGSFFSSSIRETILAMRELGMPLSIHGELAKEGVLMTERERVFLPMLRKIADEYPGLKIILEHVSSAEGIETVKSLGDDVVATITAHHLRLTLNDALSNSHNLCMPVAKGFKDRDALIRAATSGDPKFFFGSDTAPHVKELKERSDSKYGVYSAPVVPSVLAEVFEEAGKLDRLEDFTSRFASEFYDLLLKTKTITLVREEWTVPELIGGVVPFLAGQKLRWKLVD